MGATVWIVERMRYQPTDQHTDTASYRGALSHLKIQKINLFLLVVNLSVCISYPPGAIMFCAGNALQAYNWPF